MIRSTNSGPIPGSLSSARTDAVLISILYSIGLDGRSASPAAMPENTPPQRARPITRPVERMSHPMISSVIRLFTSSLRKEKKFGVKPHDRFSTSKLNAFLRLHLWPINLVVYKGSLGAYAREISSWGGLRA